jgi:hypothetical protein
MKPQNHPCHKTSRPWPVSNNLRPEKLHSQRLGAFRAGGQTTPWASIASATFTKPATLAPST